MLKLYTNTTFLTEANRSKVFPLLFDLHYVINQELTKQYQILDTVELCDIVVFPVDYNTFYKSKKDFLNLLEIAKTNKKPVWFYTSGDFGFTTYIKNSFNFRLGGFDSKLDENTFIMPSFINDPYNVVLKQEFKLLKKQDQPSIGFVGHANSGVLHYLKSYGSYLKLKLKSLLKSTYFDDQPFYPSMVKRANYLNKLKRDDRINTNFVFRPAYRAGANNPEDKNKTTQEFYNNIYNNLYTFCIRGLGNFSVRFYETLAVGRIPVLLNTDCRLPLKACINWENHAVIVNEDENVAEAILNFHESKSDDELMEIQKNNRKLWETHLRRDVYFAKVHNLFNEKIKNSDT